MLQSTSEYEERNFDDIQRALDIEHTVKALESQLCFDQHSPEEVARQILKAACKFYDADWCGLNTTCVELFCHQIVTKALIDVFGNDVETKAADFEHFTAWIKVCVSPTFLRWVFGWNGLVKIVSPQKVCEDYRQMLENALRTQEL